MVELFKNYANKYNMDEWAIKYKYEHSLRVMKLSEMICDKLYLDEATKSFASKIGLFHDIGRFRQWKLYGTYDDNTSTNHASLSVDLLYEEKILKKMTTRTTEQRWITDAIGSHNTISVSKVISQNSRLLSRILRDADKIDILSSCANGDIDLPHSDEEISSAIHRRFVNKKLANINDVSNYNERVVYYLCYLFDITYPCSLAYLKEHKIIEKFRARVKSDVLDYYFDKILERI